LQREWNKLVYQSLERSKQRRQKTGSRHVFFVMGFLLLLALFFLTRAWLQSILQRNENQEL